MACTRRQAGLAGLISFIAALITAERPASADDHYRWPTHSSSDTPNLRDSAVKIFPAQKDVEQEGSGFVIDRQEGLIISAAHVVKAEAKSVWVAFSDSNDRYPASVMKYASAHDTGHIGSGPHVVILKLDNPQKTGFLEIQLDEMEEQEHSVTGFGRGNNAPIPGARTRAGKQADCEYIIRTSTFQGDSGSAVVTPEFLVDGIVQSGKESGGTVTMGQSLVLPLACVKDEVLAAVSEKDDNRILKLLGGGNDRDLRSAFQPTGPHGDDWVSNLRLAKAVSGWIARRKNNPKFPPDFVEERQTKIMTIIDDRRLGMGLVREFTVAANGKSYDAGDALHKFGDERRKAGFVTDAMRAYAYAKDLCLSYAGSLIPDSWSPTAGATGNGVKITQAYRCATDSAIKLAEVTGNAAAVKQVVPVAAAAVFHAPNGSLKASSWAALGDVALRAGEPAIAVPAFRAAVDQGGPKWAGTKLRASEIQLGTGRMIMLDTGYLGRQADDVFRGRPPIM